MTKAEIQKEINMHYQPKRPQKPERVDKRKVYIIAGDARQADFIAHAKGWDEWEYVDSPERLKGKNVRITWYGNYWENTHQRRIREIAEAMISDGRAEEV